MTARSPTLVAHVGSVITGSRKALGITIRESDHRHYVEVRGFILKGEGRSPTDRAVTCPLVDLREMRRLLAEADARAVSLGLLPEDRA